MPHNDYAATGGLWPDAMVPLPAHIKRLDLRGTQALNGTGGGIWSPSSPLIIGGAGAQLQSASTSINGITTGPLAAAGGALILGDNDFPIFAGARTRTVRIPVFDFYASQWATGTSGTYNYDDSTTPGSVIVNAQVPLTVRIPSRLLYQGATISQIVVNLAVGAKPSAVPAINNLPLVTGVAAALAGGGGFFFPLNTWAAHTVYALGTIVLPITLNGFAYQVSIAGTSGAGAPTFPTTLGATVTDSGGVQWTCIAWQGFFSSPPPATTDAYFNAGQPQSITLVPTQNNVIDLTANTYGVIVSEDCQTNNAYFDIEITMTNIPDMRPPF